LGLRTLLTFKFLSVRFFLQIFWSYRGVSLDEEILERVQRVDDQAELADDERTDDEEGIKQAAHVSQEAKQRVGLSGVVLEVISESNFQAGNFPLRIPGDVATCVRYPNNV